MEVIVLNEISVDVYPIEILPLLKERYHIDNNIYLSLRLNINFKKKILSVFFIAMSQQPYI